MFMKHTPPPCASMLKVRKTTVSWAPVLNFNDALAVTPEISPSSNIVQCVMFDKAAKPPPIVCLSSSHSKAAKPPLTTATWFRSKVSLGQNDSRALTRALFLVVSLTSVLNWLWC